MTILYKYLDLAKFTSLLQKEALHFCRGDKFEDPFEGSYPLSAINIFNGGDNGYDSKEWRKFVAVSCWHKSDVESDAMWRLYTSNKQGVAIVTTVEKLKQAVDGHAYVKEVQYIDFIKDDAEILIPSDVFEYKRKAYIHENEIRAIITKYPRMEIKNGMPETSKPLPGKEIPKSGILIDLDLPLFIDKVIVTPYSESWFFDVIKGLAEKYNLPDGTVMESELKVDPVYAKI